MTRPVEFGTQVCGDLRSGGAREWLVPDGLGGYAMGTVSGLRTRRYHALLVVAGATPATRRVGLAALDPVVTLPSGVTVRLATHEWADGTIHPQGHALLERFELVDGLPRWRWRIGELVLERELAMRHGQACVAVIHRLVAGGPVRLALEALCTWRDQHGERKADHSLAVTPVADGAVIASGGFDAYRLRGPGWTPDGTWLHGVHHRMEAERGYPPDEDLLLAGRFTAQLAAPGATMEVLSWAGELAETPPDAEQIISAARRRHRVLTAGVTDPTAATLALAADAFIVTIGGSDAGRPDVVAGYPWFGAWSRDTMTSYEGLFLATGRVEQGAALLRGYAATLSEGMLANTADGGTVGYNTADATLWFLHAIERHVSHTCDNDLARALLPALDGVLSAHLRGTRYGIRVDGPLLRQGADGEALTWMDARVDGVPVTQRAGAAVELNALWCNGLAAVATLKERVDQDAAPLWRRHLDSVAAFRRRFPAPAGHLFDVVDPDSAEGGDPALRPNQLLAYSLPFAPMEPDPAVLRRISSALLTPLGLRSLAPDDPAFQPGHGGPQASRDRAYHQGTVWPWLIGSYVDALRRAGLPFDDALVGLVTHLDDYGLGSVSETADGAAPHQATGCPFQAWSVAELLRNMRDLPTGSRA